MLNPPESRLSVVMCSMSRGRRVQAVFICRHMCCARLKRWRALQKKRNVSPFLFSFCIRVRGRWKLFTKVLLAVKVTKSMPLPLPSESFPNQWQVQIPVCMCVCMLPRECFCMPVHLWKKNVATKTGDPIDRRQKLGGKWYLQREVSRELAVQILRKHLAVWCAVGFWEIPAFVANYCFIGLARLDASYWSSVDLCVSVVYCQVDQCWIFWLITI